MAETSFELTDREIDLIYQLCKSSQIAGIETARILVGLVDKVERHLETLKLPDGQKTFPLED